MLSFFVWGIPAAIEAGKGGGRPDRQASSRKGATHRTPDAAYRVAAEGVANPDALPSLSTLPPDLIISQSKP
ncbi:hypothetical protein JCM17478_28080 [Thermopirellula anaerolimosa]